MTEFTIVIQGPQGSGKSKLARLINEAINDVYGPFVTFEIFETSGKLVGSDLQKADLS